MTTGVGTALAASLIERLGQDCAAAAAVATLIESGSTRIAANLPVGGHSVPAVARVTRDFVARGWLVSEGEGWRRSAQPLPAGLSDFLNGAAAMRRAMLPVTDTAAVVTLPAAPSAIAQALPAQGPIHAAVRSTEETISQIARLAIRSLTIMTPFVNREGAELVVRLFRDTRAAERRLITRRSGPTRRALDAIMPELIANEVTVLNYLLPAGGGYETFHAKVVIADGDTAYVGSANMTVYARHSMELGIIVEGRTARAVASIVRAVEKIARPIGKAAC